MRVVQEGHPKVLYLMIRGMEVQIVLLGLRDQNLGLLRRTRHVLEARRSAARAPVPTYEALLRFAAHLRVQLGEHELAGPTCSCRCCTGELHVGKGGAQMVALQTHLGTGGGYISYFCSRPGARQWLVSTHGHPSRRWSTCRNRKS